MDNVLTVTYQAIQPTLLPASSTSLLPHATRTGFLILWMHQLLRHAFALAVPLASIHFPQTSTWLTLSSSLGFYSKSTSTVRPSLMAFFKIETPPQHSHLTLKVLEGGRGVYLFPLMLYMDTYKRKRNFIYDDFY